MVAIQQINQIKSSLREDDCTQLKIKCYLCDEPSHVALKCDRYQSIKGNLMKTYLV